ncbi:MAG: extracellular solute-binding protein [Spirochaetota bacterium]|nr:MAG: extracellular solute-binding protein [Spirochaetota bacterium]
MRKYKILLIVISVLLVAGMLYAKGDKEEKRGKKAKEEAVSLEGVHLKICSIDYPNTRAEIEIKHEFEEETGITVEYIYFPWEGAHEKIKMEMATQGTSYDLFQYDSFLAIPLRMMDGFAPMDSYIEDPNLPDIDPESFVDNTWIHWGLYKDEVISVPTLHSVRLWGYRKDLFDDPAEKANFKKEYGYELAPPETWDQVADIAKFFTRDTDGDGKDDFWGICDGFTIGPAWDMFADTYLTFNPIKDGKYWVDNDYNVIFDNDKAVKALQFWVDMADAGALAEGWLKRDWGSIRDVFDEGKTAMAGCWHDEFQYSETNPIVMGKVGYIKVPKYDVHHSQVSCQQYSINKYASEEHKKAAYLYLSFIKDPANDLRMAMSQHKKMPDRMVNMTNPEVGEYQPYTAGAIQGFQTGIPIPLFPEFEELYTELSIAVQSAMVHEKTAEQAIHDAAEAFTKVMEKAGYYK